MFATSSPDAAPRAYAADQQISATSGTSDLQVPLVESTDLLKGQKTVEIAHNGTVYRLQTTKLGKLILTK